MRWHLTGTHGTSHDSTEPVQLWWEDGVMGGSEVFVQEWRRLCDHYAGGTFWVGAGQPFRTSANPAADPVISFVIAVNWLPIWSSDVKWEPEVPAELLGWEPHAPNVIPIATARHRR